MDLAKDLAWKKIFSGRSTNLKIEKWCFFEFSLFSPPILSYFPIPSEHIKLQLIILILNGRSTDKKIINCLFFCDFFTFNFSSHPTISFFFINQPRERLKLAIVRGVSEMYPTCIYIFAPERSSGLCGV